MNEQELQEKIKLYEKTLSEETEKLRRMRSELAAQAKKTVADLEKSIPELEKKVSEKSAEIQGLDKVIKLKEEKANKEAVSLRESYQKLESELRTNYAKKELDLSLKVNDYEKKKELLESDKVAVRAESQSVMQRQATLASLRAEVETGVKQLEADKKAFDAEMELKMKVNNSIKDDLEAKRDELNAKITQANAKIADLNVDKSKVKSILDKKQELETKEQSLNLREAVLQGKSDELTQRNVANLAENKRLNKRGEELKAKEEALDKREANLKELEKAV